jgi:ATP-binding cassette subfamily B protein
MIVEVIGEVLMPFMLSTVINAGKDGTLTVEKSVLTAILMIVIALVMMAGGVGGAYFGAKASVNFAADLRYDVYKKVQEFSSKNIDKFSTGSLVTRLTNDVTQLQNFVNMLLRMALRSPGMMIGALIMAITLRPDLSVIFAVTIPLMLISIFGLIYMGFKRFTSMQIKIDKLNSTVQEGVTNIRVVKSFVREDYENERFNEANRGLKKAGMSALKVMIFMQPVSTIFMNITTLAVIWFGSDAVIRSGMDIGDLSAFLTYVTQILMSIMMITFLLMTSARALASARRIKEVINEKIDITADDAEHKDLTVENGKIEFKNVTFRYYKNSEEPVLDNINLTIDSGSTVGIIGSTGCGKTTLISLIPRLYDVDCGEVLVDGVNVKNYSLYNLREGVSVVLQKNVLFSGTIAENLRWGDENATDGEISAAAASAQANKFIDSFTKGYESDLGQGGSNVSGGQKQRLCIARALLKKPKILILDDSTSAVDTATEAGIRRAFREDIPNATKIIIAQRISSVIEADKIVVMDDGKITGVGTHEQLLQNNQEYKEIYYSQIEKEAEK